MAGINVNRKIFIIRPWHSASASLYPYIMDGVEYIDQTISTIKNVGKELGFEVRVDKDVFIPGKTIRENLISEISNASIVLVLLDGLRPNVTYEMGIAYGMNKRAVCLLEKDATVLVRNYYSNPMGVPTVDGQQVKIINPKISVSSAFSDNTDLLFIHYSRLDIDGLKESLEKLLNMIREQTDATFAAAEIDSTSSDEASELSGDIWNDYHAGKYSEVVEKTQGSVDTETLKVRALSLMKLGNMYEAMQTWKEISIDIANENSANFHIGICKYVIGDYEGALNYFQLVLYRNWSPEKVKPWVERTKQKISTPPTITQENIEQ